MHALPAKDERKRRPNSHLFKPRDIEGKGTKAQEAQKQVPILALSYSIEELRVVLLKHKQMNPTTSGSTVVEFSAGMNLKKQLSVLVVDDNRVNRKIVMMMLAKLGVLAQEAENGQEAVNLHLAGARFDLILIDREMPVMDGPQATRILRSMGIQCKMVGVSGNSRPSEKQEFMDAGIDEYHVKPMTRPKLICLLQQIDDDADAT